MRIPAFCGRVRVMVLGLVFVVFASIPHARVVAADGPAGATTDQEAALQAAKSLYDGITFKQLDNGLKVYLKPVPESPLVTVMVAYKVGSADEELDCTGLSHYLEHLMFKGTEKLKPGDIDKLTLQNGGANNAYTTEDYTVYYFDFAADRYEKALEVEADRMRNLRIDEKHEFEQEKGAVIAELARNEDTPWDLEYKAILPVLFGKKTPYGHPVIGEREHVKKATAEVIKAHYDKWYQPNNASLIICGGFGTPEEALARVTKLFGSIPQGAEQKRQPLTPHKAIRPDRQVIPSKFRVQRMMMGFNTVDTKSPDFYALELLQSLLSGGKTSRLYKKLIEGEQIASLASCSNSAGRYPSWFSIQVQLLEDKDHSTAEELVVKELDRLAKEPVSAAELNRVKQNVLSDTIFSRESVHGLADSIARGVTTNDLDYLKNYLPNIMKVTAEDMQKAAAKYLDPKNRVVVWSAPPEKGQESGVRGQGSGVRGQGSIGAERGAQSAERRAGESFAPRSALRAPRFADAAGPAGHFSLANMERCELPNGLTLLLLENHRLPIVAAQASVRNISLWEPEDKVGVATLTGYMLDEGTSKHKGSEIAELIDDVGGSLTLTSSGGTVKVLAPNRSLGLGLLLECLSQSNFPKEAFERNQKRLLSEISDAESQPEMKAEIEYRQMVYGNHPYGRPSLGRAKAVAALTAADCSAFHGKVFVPQNTVVAIVGDFNSEQVKKEVLELTAKWQKTELPKNPKGPEVPLPKAFTQKFVTMPEAAQLHFYMGHVGVRRSDKDYYPLVVMDYILGTGPGFTDRLSAELRDRQGLAYSVSANIASSATEEPGVFTCYIGTTPDRLDKARAVFLQEIKRIREAKPTKAEVEDVQSYLLGSLPFQLVSNERVAALMLYIERYGLGKNYVEDYKKAVKAVTPEEVQAAAALHLHPDQMVVVAAGAIDEKEGKPLPLKPPER